MIVDVFHDLVCPWCFIGKHRFERALGERGLTGLTVRWRPFLLNPAMPPHGMDKKSYLALKFGGGKRAAQAYDLIARTAARDGLILNLDGIERTPPTLDAHRLVWFAERTGIPSETAIGIIFAGYFQRGLDIGSSEALTSLGELMGLSGEDTAAYLRSDEDIDLIRASDWSARQMGIQAVPCFVFDGRYALSGAQEPDAFQPLLDLIALAPA